MADKEASQPTPAAPPPHPAARTSSFAPTAATGSTAATSAAPASTSTAIATASATATASSTPSSSKPPSLKAPSRPTHFLTKSLTTAAGTSTASSSINIRGSAFAHHHVLAPARTSSLRTLDNAPDDWDADSTASSLSQQAPSTIDDGSRGPNRDGAGLFASHRPEFDQDRVDNVGVGAGGSGSASSSFMNAFPFLGQSDGVNEFGQKVAGGSTRAPPRDALDYIRSVSHRADVRAPSSSQQNWSRPHSSDAEKAASSISRAPSPLPAASRVAEPAARPVTVETGSFKGKEKAALAEVVDAGANGEAIPTAEEDYPASPIPTSEQGAPTVSGVDGQGRGGDDGAYPDRKYYILSSAGKPIYISHLASRRTSRSRQGSRDAADEEAERRRQQELEDDEEERATTQVGVMQALISIFADDDGDRLRHINADNGRTRITFLLRSPLYFVCVSSWGEPPATTRMHLENLHLQVLSLVSAGQLSRLFARMPNFDLRRLLEGTDVLLGSLLARLQTDLCFALEALQPVRVEAPLREAVSTLLLPPKGDARPKDLLYVLLLANQRILTLLRPRRHSVHPADMHLLVNTVYGTEAIREPGGESWVPICLPKFAPQGFVHAYVSFLERPAGPGGASGEGRHDGADGDDDSSLALVMVTGDRDGFSELSAWRSDIIASLSAAPAPKAAAAAPTSPSLLAGLFDAVGRCDYSADELGIAGLRHFVYKSRTNVQITATRLEAPYEAGSDDHKRLVTLYTLAHDAIHGLSTGASVPLPGGTKTSTDLASEYLGSGSGGSGGAGGMDGIVGGGRTIQAASSNFMQKVLLGGGGGTSSSARQDYSAAAAAAAAAGQRRLPPIAGPVKMQYYQTEREAVLGWITQPFELYLTFNPWLSKTAIVAAANAVAKWVKQNEQAVFITSALTF
ncbi:uncharacterized protein PFL1_01222 [Pseudozyma flocculosa PF-1]|uniref:Vacuolar fusion protein MON1 n=1 Tax=Pseudozyma flocculosa TaxID=84751 RepID=A0A5C3EWB0_9BASI|nr:uncharacterized protein PFL1_01222 [Pseudozyma flocculosa PF-1]EPQ31033.1 hypothetical protein PFL1_01222 [Pseudozyma flocculosa PF-1]SPO35876.1 uncharacterized protein PSFLO_01347 [Pseudozyma flocculosa]